MGIAVENKEDSNNVIGGSLTEGYAAVVKWINSNGYRIIAPPYEIYTKSHVDNLPVSEWETEIYFPVEKI
ncbi:MAG: GyrI-like domain-containing protein [Clostridiales bacterium]|nr:GyrI-like domain-containing protein [Clostridiales bacterium]